jgi:hypothetical protein
MKRSFFIAQKWSNFDHCHWTIIAKWFFKTCIWNDSLHLFLYICNLFCAFYKLISVGWSGSVAACFGIRGLPEFFDKQCFLKSSIVTNSAFLFSYSNKFSWIVSDVQLHSAEARSWLEEERTSHSTHRFFKNIFDFNKLQLFRHILIVAFHNL